MKKIKGLSAAIFAAFLLASCAPDDTQTDETSEEEVDELVLGFFPSADVENMSETAEPFGEYLLKNSVFPLRRKC
ncbi:MAG: hypothetical protein U5K84_12605 [Alkalibacterium sp.]|nr:hypothetical protein [Alkalibacterium sp.]